MTTRNVSSLVALCGALALGAGCASEPASHLVTAPPPPAPTSVSGSAPAAPQQIVVTQPQQVIVTQPQQVVTTVAVPANGGTSYVVLQAPPAPQAPEAVPERPSSAHVWINGYWTWQNNRYAWMAGHWEVPPFSGAAWANPHWQAEGGAYRFFEGRWN